MFTHFFNSCVKEESGQGITEYGAVLAFTACIIAATLAAGQSSFGLAIKNSFSATANALSQLATSAS